MTRSVLFQLSKTRQLNKNELNSEIDMEEQSVLERLTNVYEESVACLAKHTEASAELSVVDAKQMFTTRQVPSITNIEIDGNYLLFFNDIYRSRFRAWLKQILKQLTWSILKRQVYFNSATRDVLYKLMQQDYEFQLNQMKVQVQVSELEQQVQQLSEQVKTLSTINQQAMSLLESISRKQPEIIVDLKGLVGDRDV